jgi:hypothetical protein
VSASSDRGVPAPRRALGAGSRSCPGGWW